MSALESCGRLQRSFARAQDDNCGCKIAAILPTNSPLFRMLTSAFFCPGLFLLLSVAAISTEVESSRKTKASRSTRCIPLRPGRPKRSSTRFSRNVSGTATRRTIRPATRSRRRSRPPKNWRISSWTADWYARDDWEKELGPNFYQHGVFDRRYGGDLQGVIDKLDYLQRPRDQLHLFQPPLLLALDAQIRWQQLSSHRPEFRPRSQGRPRPDRKGNRRSLDLAVDRGGQAFPQGDQGSHAARHPGHHRRRLQSHRARFFRLPGPAQKPGEIALQGLVRGEQLRRSRERSGTSSSYKGWWGHATLPVFAATADGKDMLAGPEGIHHAGDETLDAARRQRPVVRHRRLAARRGG